MKRISAIMCGVAAIAILPGLAVAQTAPVAHPTVAAQDAATGLEDIVVTARRVEERAQDIPLAVTALSGQALVNQQIGEVRDLSAKAPNLVVSEPDGDRQAVTLTIRGQGAGEILLTTDSSVGFYLDGVNVPRTLGFRNALLDIQRAEILRGPQGTLYGRNTTGGAISIYSQDPKPGLGGQFIGSTGNYGAYSAAGVVNLPLSDQVGLRLVAQHSEHDGYGRQITGRETEDENNSYLRAKIRGDFGDLRASLAADYSTSKGAGSSHKLVGLADASGTAPRGRSLTQEIALALGQPLNAAGYAVALAYLDNAISGSSYEIGVTSPQYSNFHGFGTSLNLDYDMNDSLSVRSITGYREIHRKNSQDIGGVLDAFTNLQRTDDDFWSQELQLIGNHGAFNWVAGVFYSKEDGTEYSNSFSLPRLTAGRVTVYDGDITSESRAVFAQGTWRFLPRWALTVGARYTEETKGLVTRNQSRTGLGVVSCSVPTVLRDDPAVCLATLENTFSDPSWLASLDYKATDDILLYAKVARGFRAGGQNFRGLTLMAFTPFQPEYATEYEIGFKSELLDHTIRLNLAAFYTDYEDVQRTVTYLEGLSTATAFTNAANASISGIEGELEWRVTPAFTLSASGGLIEPKYDEFVDFTGDRTNEDWPAPKFTGSVSGRYVAPTSVGDLAVQVNYAYQSDRNLRPASAFPQYTIQDAYGLLSARLSLDLDRYDAQVALYGRNLTDKDYAAQIIGVDAAGFITKIAGEPRTWGVEFRKRFGGG